MRSKGFTLIELLAVIVILAIIALIATPIVLGIIEDSRQNTNELTAGFIVESVEKSYSMAFTKNSGAIPTLQQVKNEFGMNGAEWNVETKDGKEINKIVTPNGQVECEIILSGYDFSVECKGTGIENINSETMEVSATISAAS